MDPIPNWVPVYCPWERRPAEYVPRGPPLWHPGPTFEGPFGEVIQGFPMRIDVPSGWYQGGRRLDGKVKRHYAFIWPKDGKRGTTMGRWKDLLQNKGPDIHVSIGADKGDHLYNRQRKPRWAEWTHMDPRGPDGALPAARWTRKHRRPGVSYDFKTRKYGRENGNTWTDVRWPMEPNEGMPAYAYRDLNNRWWQNQPEPELDFDNLMDDEFAF